MASPSMSDGEVIIIDRYYVNKLVWDTIFYFND